jgi:putative methyltransferase (TIGR04325 family)
MLSFIKKLLPWYVRRSLAQARRLYAVRKPPFEGVYADFREVPSTGAWDSRIWIQESLRSAEAARRQIGKALPDTRALLPLLTAGFVAENHAASDAPLRILDFGGGAGQDYAALKASMTLGRELRYQVVDTPACCEAGGALWRGDPGISFAAELPDNASRFDIVLASSSLFYAENFRELLRVFSGYHPALMLFGKTPVHEGASFVRAQTNLGGGLRIPHWVIGFEDLKEALELHGYALVYRTYDDNAYNAENYPEEYRVDRTAQFVFARSGRS